MTRITSILFVTCIALATAGCRSLSPPSNVETVSAVQAQTTTHVGSNKGRFKASSSGEASFTIPIPVPPGIQEQQPKLSFSFSSATQNGLMGVGWSLTGFSKITRVKRIIAIDGVSGQISFDNSDRFALGGQRLLVMTGDNGADGSIYKTEIDTWKRVVSQGAAGSGPERFTVTQPDGSVLEFGGTTDARPLAVDGVTVREWLLNKITDRNGNTLTIGYSTDPTDAGTTNSQTYPTEIAYGTNPGGRTQADRFVRLHYESRPDPLRHFLGGTEIRTELRLSAVSTYVGDTLVSQYRLRYDASPSNSRSRLISVQRFASEETNAEGLAPTTFAYSDGSNAFNGGSPWIATAFTANSGWDNKQNPVTMADVNGDGLTDIIGFKDGTQVSLATATSYSNPTTWINNFSPEFNWDPDQPRFLADINGDGLADIVGFSLNGVVTALADGPNGQFVQQPSVFPHFAPNRGWDPKAPRYLADVNGDQALDIVGFNDGVQVALANVQGSFDDPTTWCSDFGLRQGWEAQNLLLADMNGDGKSDVVAMNQLTLTINVALSTGSAFVQTGWDQSYQSFASNAEWGPDNPRMFSDVNGDGLTDIIGFSSNVQVGLSNGTGFEPAVIWSNDFGSPNWDSSTPRKLMDVNADGMADILAVAQNNVQIALSTGSSFVPGSWNQTSLNQLGLASGGSAAETERLPVDVNADGLTDLVGFTPAAVVVGLVAGNYPDQLTTITRSSGGQVEVVMRPISDPSVYSETPGDGALSKFQRYRPINQNNALPVYRSASRLTGHFYVVASSTMTNNPAISGRDFSYGVSHRYKDGASSNLGRGWLGFGRSTHTNDSIGRTTTIQYNQKFPLIGRPSGKSLTCAADATACTSGEVYHEDFYEYETVDTDTSSTTGFKAQMVSVKSVRSDKFQGSTYQHSLGQTFKYDMFGNRIQVAKLNLVTRRGADVDPSDNVYYNASFSGDTANWFLSYPLFQKTSASASLAGIESFDASEDFSLVRHQYDAVMNQTGVAEWDQGNSAFVGNGFTYDRFGNRTSQTASNGATTTYEIDTVYNTYEVKQTTPANVDGLQLTTQFAYDARFGRRSLRQDANGNRLVTCYDGFGRRAVIQGPLPEHADTSLKADTCLGDTIVPAPSGPAPNMANLITFDHAWEDGIATVRRTSLESWQLKGRAAQTRRTVTYYDGLDRDYRRITQAEDGSLTRVLKDDTFNSMHQPLLSLLPHFTADTAPNKVTMTYDPLDRTIANTAPWTTGGGVQEVNAAISYETTDTGEKTVRNEAQGTDYELTVTTEQGYFANDAKPVSVSYTDARAGGARAQTTALSRDLLGRVTVLSPPGSPAQGNTPITCATGPTGSGPETALQALYAYDSMGRICARTLPALGTTKFTYGTDALLQSRDQNNGTTRYAYDAMGRRLTVRFPGLIRVAFVYDDVTPGANALGQLASAKVTGQAQDVLRRYTYDAYGFTATSSLTVGEGAAFVTKTTYDPVGRPVQQTLPDGTTVETTFTFGNLTKHSVGGTAQLSAGDFTAFGLPQTLSFGNGSATSIKYGAAFHVASVVTKLGATTVFEESYDRDPLGFVLSTKGMSQTWPNYTRTQDYANLRLTSVSDTRLANTSLGFGYDSAGNLSAAGKLKVRSDGYLLGQGSSYAGAALDAKYDMMGNLTAASAPALAFNSVYDGRNRLSKMTVAAGSAEFAYDHQGNRVWRKDTAGAEYIYTNPRHTRISTSGGETDRIVLHGAMGPAYVEDKSDGTPRHTRYLHTDERRSVIAETSTSGALLHAYLYSPFGLVATGSTSTSPLFGFQGRIYDADTGLYYYSARYYDPRLGRFTRADTRFGAEATRPDAANRYAYMLNNPAFGFDPSGHAVLGCVLSFLGGVGSATAGGFNVYLGIANKNYYQAGGVGGAALVGAGLSIAGGILACRRAADIEQRLRALENPGDGDGANGANGQVADNGAMNQADDGLVGDGANGANGQEANNGAPDQANDDAVANNDAANQPNGDGPDGNDDNGDGLEDVDSDADGNAGVSTDEDVNLVNADADSEPLGSIGTGDAEAGASELTADGAIDGASSLTLSTAASSDAAATTTTAATSAVMGDAGGLAASTTAATETASAVGTADAVGTAASTAATATTAATTEVVADVAVGTTATAGAGATGFEGFLAFLFALFAL